MLPVEFSLLAAHGMNEYLGIARGIAFREAASAP